MTRAPMTSDLFGIVGRIVEGRYRVESVAGQGGFGVVYRARHLGFESPIALKVLKLPEYWSLERKRARVASFQREGRMLFELSALHPSIVRAFETGTIAGPDGSPAPYLALEWLDGASLDHESRLRRKRGLAPMTLQEVLGLLHGPAQGLARAHARGVAHRDVKPGNLFVSVRGGETCVKILDFGIAKMVDTAADTTAQYAATAGTTASFTAMYAAPEQWLERLGATGTWTDVHALALVCVELLSGTIPFAGREPAQFMAACLDPALRPTPKSRGIELATEVEAVFAKAVALEPRERFRDVGQFWHALAEAACWSPEHPAMCLELVSAQQNANRATDVPVVLGTSEGGDSRALPSADTTATASLAGHRVPHARRPSLSRWLPHGAITIAVTGVGGYLVSNGGEIRVNGEAASGVSARSQPQPIVPRPPTASRTVPISSASPTSVAPERARGLTIVSPTRGHRGATRRRPIGAPTTPIESQPAPPSDGRTAKEAPEPAASTMSAGSPRITPTTPQDEPKPSVNYDDPALTRRR
jgi:serine/threonine protein kinase